MAKKKHAKFIDLGETSEAPKMAKPEKKWYPKLHLKKAPAGINRPGDTKTVRMRVRCSSVRMDKDRAPEFSLEALEMSDE